MNWSRCSKALVVALFVLATVVAPAAAVTAKSDGVPDEAKQGTKVSATYTFTDLYTDYEQWTLHGETNLTGVTWTVRQLDQAGNQVSQNSYDGQSFNESVSLQSDTAKVVVKVTGTVPQVENFTYQPPERFLFASFAQLRKGGASDRITADRVHHFTEQSKKARTQIRQAQQAVNGSGSAQAKKTLQNAISAYEAGNFANAIDLANQAEQTAKQAQQSQARTQLLLYGAIGVVALLLVGGGVYYWRSQQDSYDKLR